MSFNITIQADSSAAEQSVSRLGDKLRDVESAGQNAGGKLSTALKDSGEAADSAGESIHGMGVELEGSLSQSLLGRFGEFGSLLGDLTSKGTLAAGGVAALGAEVLHLGDEYTQLQNHALRLADSFEHVDDVIAQQNDLSKQLHGSLDQTMELSIAMKERAGELGLSMTEQAQYTKEWAQMVQLSGHSMQDAGAALDKFTFALQLGQNGGKQMRQVFQEFPPLMEALEDHFGLKGPHALQDLIEKAKHGEISMRDAFAAMDEHAAQTTEKFGHMQETLGQQWQHMKDDITVSIGKLIEESGAVKSLGEAFHGLGVLIEASLVPLQKLDEALGSGNLKEVLTSGLLSNIGKLVSGDDDGQLKTMGDFVKELNQGAQTVKLGQLASDADVFGAALGRVNQILDYGAGKTHDWLEAHKQAKAAISDEQKLLNEINGPMEHLMANEMTLARLYGDSRISLGTYTIEMEKFREQLDQLNTEQAKLGVAALGHTLGAGAFAAVGSGIAGAIGGAGKAALGGAAMLGDRDKVLQMAEDSSAIRKYLDEVKSLNEAQSEGLISSGDYSIALTKLRDRYNDMKSPAEQFAKAVEGVNERLKAHIYTTDEAERAIEKLKVQYGQGNFGDGLKQGLRDVSDEFGNISKGAADMVKHTFGTLNDQLANIIMGQKTDWAGFVKSIEADLIKISLQKAESAAIGALFSSGAGAYMGGDATIPQAALGWSGRINGWSPPDTNLFMARVSPGETVSIKPQHQQQAAQMAQPMAPNVRVVAQIGKDDILQHMDSPEGERLVMSMVRRNSGSLRSYTGGR
jgi:tape measure domain-containing protein